MKKFLTLTALLICSCVIAQTPQSVNYQGIARDLGGSPLINQVLGIELTIHSGSPTGTIVYQETHTPTTNQFGLYTTQMGMGTPVSGTFSAISWGTNTYYLEIGMDPTGGNAYVAAGTTQLISVPYALYAETSGSSTPGPAGPTGANGLTGATGPSGDPGINGTNGATGATGAAGINGSNGATGATGAAGINGTNGATGAAGINGTNGATGATGAAGINGTNGATGATGVTGATGASGSMSAEFYQATFIGSQNVPNNGSVIFSGSGPNQNIAFTSSADFTVSSTGTFLITTSLACTSAGGWRFSLFKNGVAVPAASFIVNNNTSIATSTTLVSANSGDVFQLRNISGSLVTVGTFVALGNSASITILKIQ